VIIELPSAAGTTRLVVVAGVPVLAVPVVLGPELMPLVVLVLPCVGVVESAGID
jgi:hypothetical protein